MASRIHRRRLSVFGYVAYADSQKRHQPTPRYTWPWTLEPVTDPTTDRSGNADEDDPVERGCSRLKKTVGNDAWRIAHDRKSWRALPPVAGQTIQ